MLYIYSTTALFSDASVKDLNISSSHHTIGKYSRIFEDTTASLELLDILQLPKQAFKDLNKPVSSHGFSNSTFWYSFTVSNSEKRPLQRIFVFEPAWLDDVEIYIITSEGKTVRYQGGNKFNFDVRALNHYLTNFKHTFETGKSQVYIKVQTRDPFITSISLMDELTFLSEDSFYSFWIGLFYGGMIALLIYNLFLYFGIRRDLYLYYVFYLFSFLLVNAAYNGYTFMSLFSYSPELQNWSQAILSYIFASAALLFANSFLNLKKYHPTLHKTTRFLLLSMMVLAIFTALLGGYQYNIMFGIISVMCGSIYIACIALYSWLKGNRSARFFLLGAISGLIGVFITAITLMSLIPYTYFTFKASDFGMYIDIILLSFALADRMKMTQIKRRKAELDAQTDALTGLLNRRAFYTISAIESQKLLCYHHDFSVIMLDIDNFKKINDTYGHHIGDTVLTLVASCIKEHFRDCDYLFRLGGDEFILFLPDCKKEEAYTLAKQLLVSITQIDLNQQDNHLSMSCSIGISEFKEHDEGIDAIVRRADEALYEVKHSGKNSIKLKDKETQI